MKLSNKVFCVFALVMSLALILMGTSFGDDSIRTNNPSSFIYEIGSAKQIIGNQTLSTKTISLNNFNAINIGGDFDANITQGKQNSISITTDNNILPYTIVSESNSGLSIGTQPGVQVSPSQPIKISITTTSGLENINLGGNTKLNATLDKQKFLNLNIGGNGTITLSGSANNFVIASGGKANVNAKDFVSDNIVINSAGQSNLNVHAVNTLNITSVGDSIVTYFGNPTINKNSVGNLSLQQGIQ